MNTRMSFLYYAEVVAHDNFACVISTRPDRNAILKSGNNSHPALVTPKLFC